MPLSSFQLEELGLSPSWKPRPSIPNSDALPSTLDTEGHAKQQVVRMQAQPGASLSAPTDSAQTATSALDWPELEARVQTCTLCGLCETRTQTVFGAGYPQADWMLIGEAPGAQEDREGKPFVGQAGKLLNNMLHAIGLTRTYPLEDAKKETDEPTGKEHKELALPLQTKQPIYIANILKCRPPGNRDPLPDEVAKCEPYLQRQLALVRPKLILALGRIAAQSLLKTKATISSLRGRIHDYEGIPVIVTYHPAYLLRNLPDKSKAWEDLCFAREVEAGL